MNTYSLLFYPKKSTSDISSIRPLYMRVTVNSQRLELATNRKWDTERWNQQVGRAMGTKEDARSLNAHLETLKAKVHEAHRQLVANNEPVTIEAIREKFLGKPREKKMFLEIFKKHNADALALIDNGFAKATIIRYATAYSHTESFIKWKYKKDDIAIDDLSYEFVSQFEFWLKSQKGCNHNSAMKYITNMKKIVVLCLKHGWLQRDPFFGFKKQHKEVVREFLNPEEIQLMVDKTFPTERLALVRDIFVFSCYTGLCYADIEKLKRSEIVVGVDGGQWIHTRRQKTETVSKIPLLPTAFVILQIYKDHPRCCNENRALPILSNQKMNAYLQEIATLCGISKTLTFHCARHTFATTVTLTNGVPIESVSKMLGHKNLKTTQHYAKILDMKVSEDMKVLQKKLDMKKEEVSKGVGGQ